MFRLLGTLAVLTFFSNVLNVHCLCPTQCQCNDGLLKSSCSGGQLTTVPITLNPRLKELYLNDNRIRQLAPNSLNFYSNLEILSLSSNRLVTLGRRSFGSLRKLQLLFVDGNQLTELDRDSFSGLSSALVLSLARNGLERIEARIFEPLHSLEELDLSSNKIDYIDELGLIGLERLKVLTIRDNRIREMLSPQLFAPMQQLIRLDFGVNTLVGETFDIGTLSSVCPSLRDIRADYAGLAGLRGAEKIRVGALRALDLRGNLITALGQENDVLVRSLKCLDIRDNPLVCNCSLKWIRPVLANLSSDFGAAALVALSPEEDIECAYTTDRIASSVYCYEPDAVRNQSVAELDFDDRRICFESFATELEESLAFVWAALLVCSAAATLILIYVKAALFRPAYPKVLSTSNGDSSEHPLWPADSSVQEKLVLPTRLHITSGSVLPERPQVRLSQNPLENFDNPNHVEHSPHRSVGHGTGSHRSLNRNLFAVASGHRYVNRYDTATTGPIRPTVANL